MSKISILRATLVTAVVASAACSSRSAMTLDSGGPGLPDASMGEGDASVDGDGPTGSDASVGGDAGADVSQSPQLNLPGIVVWLDGDVGIDAAGSPLMTWSDRSAYGHVFMAQSAEGDMPTIAQLNGHGAVRFNGRNRFISEHVPSATQQDALSLGTNFVVAIVFVPEAEVTHETILTLAMLPWISSPPPPDLSISSSATFSIMAHLDPARSFQVGASGLRVGGGFALAPQRLLLSTEGGSQVRVRLNGQLQTGTREGVADPSGGAYAPIYLGAWDFDTFGFEGAVAEMVIVRGGADPATEQALDDYLKLKFSL